VEDSFASADLSTATRRQEQPRAPDIRLGLKFYVVSKASG
jgi:hypothetical protein